MRAALYRLYERLAVQSMRSSAANEASTSAFSTLCTCPQLQRSLSTQGTSTSGRMLGTDNAAYASLWVQPQRHLASSSAALAARSQPNTAGALPLAASGVCLQRVIYSKLLAIVPKSSSKLWTTAALNLYSFPFHPRLSISVSHVCCCACGSGCNPPRCVAFLDVGDLVC